MEEEKIVDVVKGIYNGFETCESSMRNSGLRSFFDKRLYISEEALELLKGDQGLKAKLLKLINI